MPKLSSICVFCGSSPGLRPIYLEAAAELGSALVRRNIDLVYGGADVGVMGHIAHAVLERGGRVTGVIPQSLVEKEVAYKELADLHIVGSMHERKARMEELSDGFIALPGGLGTLEELAEILTWAQLGFHTKPIAVWNVDGYYDGLLEFLQHMVRERFVKPSNLDLLIHDTDVERLLDRMEQYEPPADIRKWMEVP